MFRIIRRWTRPLAAAVLAGSISPSITAECRPLGDPAAGMPCCQKQTHRAAWDAECCAVRQPAPAPERGVASVPTFRPLEGKLALAPAASLPFDPSPVLHAVVPSPASQTGPPHADLYLLNSVFRR
jgi:hypothetical protein